MTCPRVLFWEPGCHLFHLLDGPGFRIVVGTKIFHFSKTTRPALGYRVSLPGLNWAGCEVDHLHPSSPEVRVELYLCPPYIPS